MQSFAFWYEAENEIKNISAKLNFNLWTECGWKKNTQYLDVGFLLLGWQPTIKLNFFVPFDVDIANIYDLGEFFKTPELASAIFNENLQSAPEENKKDFLVRNKDTNSDFIIYCLDIKKDLEIIQYNESTNEKNNDSVGTIIRIDLSDKNLDSSKPLYFRFRIKDVNLNNLVKKYSTDKHGLQSVFNTTYTVDFRFYNKRSLDKSLLEQINNHFIIPIDSIHFLVITKTHVNLVTSECQGRKLEENVWDEYVNSFKTKNKTTDLIAYHFKEKFKKGQINGTTDNLLWDNKNGACEFFIKYEVEKSIWLIYLFLTIGLGALGSFLSTLFCHFVFPQW